ncbi:hypothetical protein [Acanthamoeba polyphaga mimivirus]|uniref:Bro-N domain-containing protein n=1 Tax=Acanthamoeba polyphaga mimivirus TaxID=212035 RepID=A0A2L2DKS2_MIMIV|nr:hypothetical protein [Acanthamoeba polyphaga mimivirus]
MAKSRKFDKVFIRTSWLEEKLNNDSDDEDSNDQADNELDSDNDNDNDNNKITLAPGIIKLTKNEKLKDNKGNIVEIEVRGTRDHNNCYFRVSDVAKGFCMKKLCDHIVQKGTGYKQDKDYKFFYLQKNPLKKDKIKNGIKKLFLTYEGLLRVLFVSRNKTVGKFIGWATKTLFTAHLGTQEQKNLLSSKLMGVSADIVEQVFNKTSSTLPVIYLFTIGKVKDLRTVLDIGDEYDDECIVAKGGETIDLTRRIGEHNKTYAKIPGVKLY